jgi:hypothetical protein
MLRLHRSGALLPLLLLAVACAEAPTGPTTDQPGTTPPDLSVITPFLLPPGADWGLYFASFNPNRALNARVIHYPSGSVTGNGSFAIPGAGSGVLRVTGLESIYGGYLPERSSSGTVPESAVVTGVARFLGRLALTPFRLDLHSNLWPNPTNTYDTATLTFCYTSTNCVAYSFYGELHHEPQ